MKKRVISRRKLLRNTALAATGSVLLLNMPVRTFASNTLEKTRVVLIRNRKVLQEDGSVDPVIIGEMLDEAVTALTGAGTARQAWKTILKPSDVLGIKTNEWGRLPTPAAREQAIKERARRVGISDEAISIADRSVMHDPVFQRSTALINTRPLRTHAWAGLGTLLKNYITFVDNKPDYHPDSCAGLTTLWDLPAVKGKTRLNILVVLTPLFYGVGPHHFNRKYVWPYYGLLVGFDPVAVDSVGVRLINAKRFEYFGEERPINPPPKHVMLADTRFHLGTADPSMIELIRLGDRDNELI